MIQKHLIVAAAIGLLSARDALAAQPACLKENGYIGGPFVPTSDVAVAIYRAVATVIAPSKLRTFPIIIADDEGDHWVVSQEARPERAPRLKPGEVIVQVGGGQLAMSIDKCTGAISSASYCR